MDKHFHPRCAHPGVIEGEEKGEVLEAYKPPVFSSGQWVRTKDKLPCEVGEQVFILMWSPHWAKWVDGMFTYYEDKQAWASYDPNEDRFYDWHEPPEWWLKVKLPKND